MSRNSVVVAVGHGTRNPVGQQQFLALAEALRANSAVPVSKAYVELQEPGVAVELLRLSRAGQQAVVLAPLLLFAGGHAKSDLPREIAAAQAECPQLAVRQANALGCSSAIIAGALERSRAALEGEPEQGDLLLVVGRGGSDPEAIAEAREFARLLAEELGLPHRAAFIAVAQPSLASALDELAHRPLPPRRVLVQPHLLFQGEMQRSVEATVATARGNYPAIDWRVARPLGDGLELPAGERDPVTLRVLTHLVTALQERIAAAPTG